MKVSRCSSLLALALWHVSCDGTIVGAPEQPEGSFSTEVAPYEGKMNVPDESESYVRELPRELYALCVIELDHLSSLECFRITLSSDFRRKAIPSHTGTEK